MYYINIDENKYLAKKVEQHAKAKFEVHKKLEPILKAIALGKLDRPFVLVYGGRASTKSTVMGGALSNILSFEDNFRILYTRFTASSIQASTKLDFEDGQDMLGIPQNVFSKSNYMYTNRLSGSKVLLEGIKAGSNDNEGKNKSKKNFNVWICDEATDIPDVKTFQTISQSIRVKGVPNYKILVLNPSHKNHWIYKEFFTPEGLYYNLTYRIKINYIDVERFLSDEFIREAEEVRRLQIEVYNNLYLGDWRDKVDGAVFKYILKPFPEGRFTSCYGIDFGTTDGYNAVVKVAIDFHAKHIYLKEVAYFNQSGVDFISKVLHERANNAPLVPDIAARQTILDLQQRGHNFSFIKKPEVEYSVNVLQDYVIFVDPDSPNLIREMDIYRRIGGIIKRADDHSIDAWRYGAWWLIRS